MLEKGRLITPLSRVRLTVWSKTSFKTSEYSSKMVLLHSRLTKIIGLLIPLILEMRAIYVMMMSLFHKTHATAKEWKRISTGLEACQLCTTQMITVSTSSILTRGTPTNLIYPNMNQETMGKCRNIIRVLCRRFLSIRTKALPKRVTILRQCVRCPQNVKWGK